MRGLTDLFSDSISSDVQNYIIKLVVVMITVSTLPLAYNGTVSDEDSNQHGSEYDYLSRRKSVTNDVGILSPLNKLLERSLSLLTSALSELSTDGSPPLVIK